MKNETKKRYICLAKRDGLSVEFVELEASIENDALAKEFMSRGYKRYDSKGHAVDHIRLLVMDEIVDLNRLVEHLRQIDSEIYLSYA